MLLLTQKALKTLVKKVYFPKWCSKDRIGLARQDRKREMRTGSENNYSHFGKQYDFIHNSIGKTSDTIGIRLYVNKDQYPQNISKLGRKKGM
ncbi:MAG TPA: hypothetical protein PKO16_07880 [Bacteroidia bacterium]|jgi:hypothetical protein|nr:hypothetical protein [Bacteroidia bacterium]